MQTIIFLLPNVQLFIQHVRLTNSLAKQNTIRHFARLVFLVDRHSLKRLLLSRYIFKPTGEDLTSIATLLSDEQWTQRPTTTLLLARSIVKILCKMHECDIIHGELNADTVFVTSRNLSEVSDCIQY